MIANISGSSGSGKTTLVAHLLSLYPSVYRKLISYTSRTKRSDEKNAIDYYFVKKEFFSNKSDFILERDRPDGFYAVLKKDLFLDERIILTTFPPKGVLLLEEMGIQVNCFYLYVTPEECMRRMIQRGDSLIEIERRLFLDEKESTLEITREILNPRVINLLDGHMPINEIGLALHELLLPFTR